MVLRSRGHQPVRHAHRQVSSPTRSARTASGGLLPRGAWRWPRVRRAPVGGVPGRDPRITTDCSPRSARMAFLGVLFRRHTMPADPRPALARRATCRNCSSDRRRGNGGGERTSSSSPPTRRRRTRGARFGSGPGPNRRPPPTSTSVCFVPGPKTNPAADPHLGSFGAVCRGGAQNERGCRGVVPGVRTGDAWIRRTSPVAPGGPSKRRLK